MFFTRISIIQIMSLTKILKQSLDEHNKQELDMTNMKLNLNDVIEERNTSEENQHLLLVPCQGKKRDLAIKSMKEYENFVTK